MKYLSLVSLSGCLTFVAIAPAHGGPEVTEPGGELFGFIRPGQGWTSQTIAEAAVGRAPQIAEAKARLEAASSRNEVASARLLPRTLVVARYTRLSRIDNDPLVPLSIDLEAARAGVAQIQDPAAQAVIGAQLDQLAGLAGGSIEIPENQYALSAEASYPVSQLFFEILPGLRASEAAKEARVREVDVARNVAAIEAIEAFLGHARARSAEAVARVSVRQAKTNVAAAEARLSGRTGTKTDVLRLQARLARAERDLAERQADVGRSAEAVRTLAGLAGSGPLDVGETLFAIESLGTSVSKGDEVELAWSTRDELAAVDYLVKARAQAESAARGAILPQLLASARVDYANPNNLFVPPGDTFRTSWNLSAVLQWSPDGAWSASRAANAAGAERAEAEARRAALMDLIRIEVVGARARRDAGRLALEAATRELAAAGEGYRSVKKGFELGLFDATDLIGAELELEQARLGLVDAGIELRIREARLRRARGDHLWKRG